jgi:hypothetical protein
MLHSAALFNTPNKNQFQIITRAEMGRHRPIFQMPLIETDPHLLRYKYGMSQSTNIGELGYVAKYGKKCKEGKVVVNHVIPISSIGIFYSGRVLLHYQ